MCKDFIALCYLHLWVSESFVEQYTTTTINTPGAILSLLLTPGEVPALEDLKMTISPKFPHYAVDFTKVPKHILRIGSTEYLQICVFVELEKTN